MLQLSNYPFKVLEIGDNYSFDCGDTDLTEFFLQDAIPHKKELIGVTYFFYDDSSKSAVSFFTCRFLTVDAYNKPEILEFYSKNGFTFLYDKDVHKQIRAMKYDLKLYFNESSIDSYANR